jgi:hypothetical protein
MKRRFAMILMGAVPVLAVSGCEWFDEDDDDEDDDNDNNGDDGGTTDDTDTDDNTDDTGDDDVDTDIDAAAAVDRDRGEGSAQANLRR